VILNKFQTALKMSYQVPMGGQGDGSLVGEGGGVGGQGSQ
jgi:hypothetical protein